MFCFQDSNSESDSDEAPAQQTKTPSNPLRAPNRGNAPQRGDHDDNASQSHNVPASAYKSAPGGKKRYSAGFQPRRHEQHGVMSGGVGRSDPSEGANESEVEPQDAGNHSFCSFPVH